MVMLGLGFGETQVSYKVQAINIRHEKSPANAGDLLDKLEIRS